MGAPTEDPVLPEAWRGRVRKERCFYSKRNQVFLGRLLEAPRQLQVVVKIHACPETAAREARLLGQLRRAGVRVPRLLEAEGRHLLLEYLPGPLVSDLMDQGQSGGEWVRMLVSWLSRLHRFRRRAPGAVSLKGDVNLRNFLVCRGRLYGLDFEREHYGPPEEDLGRASAFILTHSPAFTPERWERAREFALAALEGDPRLSGPQLEREMIEELGQMAERRPDHRPRILEVLKERRSDGSVGLFQAR